MDNSRLISVDRITASNVITNRPCLVMSICGIGIAEISNVYTVYDGQSTTGNIKFRLVAGSYSADFRLFAEPIYFAHGIYVDFTTNGEEVCVQYLELAR